MSEPGPELELALNAALRAGAITLQYFGTALDVTLKSPGQPVTEADLAVDRMLRDMLLTAYPEMGWLSEETPDTTDRLGRGRVWVVDPIDGTRSFIAGRPEYTISIGLVEAGAAILGVVHNPATGELYWATRGGGAWGRVDASAAEAPLRVMEDAGRRLVLASRSELGKGGLQTEGWSFSPSGSTAYKLARVGAGAASAFVSRRPKSEWDVCAGGLIVEEAGGKVTDLAGSPLRFNEKKPRFDGIIAAAAGLHAELFERYAAERGRRRKE